MLDSSTEWRQGELTMNPLIRSRACCTVASVTAGVLVVEALLMRRFPRPDTQIATTFLAAFVEWDWCLVFHSGRELRQRRDALPSHNSSERFAGLIPDYLKLRGAR